MFNQILSIYGLYVYDNTLFDLLKIPEGLDKTVLVDNIILELGCFETIYPDAQFMKHAIGAWSNKELTTWEELYKTLLYEYDPISNYDRTEEMTYTKSGNSKDSGSGEMTNSGEGRHSESGEGLHNESGEGQNSNSGSGEHSESGSGESTSNKIGKISAYNSPNLENKDGEDVAQNNSTENSGSNSFENTGSDSFKNTGSNSFENTGSNSFENAGSNSFENNREFSETFTHKGNTKGNIGVTTTQQMIEAQRNVVKFNIYNHIIDSFKSRFCVLVY